MQTGIAFCFARSGHLIFNLILTLVIYTLNKQMNGVDSCYEEKKK